MEASIPVEIRVPSLGESIVDAVIASWLKHEGDNVSQGDALVELETDKVNVEVTAEQNGVLQKIIKQEGDTVAVDEVLGVIDEGAAAGNGQKTSAERQQPPVKAASDGQRPPSPLARRIAAEKSVDLSQVQGTSPHGRITRDDVIRYLDEKTQQVAPTPDTAEQATASPVPSPAPVQSPAAARVPPPVQPLPHDREERVRLSRRRQTIAQRLVEAQQNAAMLTTFNEIDMSAVMEVRSRRKESFKE